MTTYDKGKKHPQDVECEQIVMCVNTLCLRLIERGNQSTHLSVVALAAFHFHEANESLTSPHPQKNSNKIFYFLFNE